MTEARAITVDQLLNQFITLRKTGTNRDDAWYIVMDEAGDELDSDVRKQFLQQAKDWEKREGHQYRFQSKTDASETMVTTTTDLHKTKTMPTAAIEEPPISRGSTSKMDSVDPSESAIDEIATLFDRETQLSFYFHDFPDVITVDVPMGQEVVIGRKTPNAAMSPDVDLSPVKAEAFGVSRMHAMLRRRQNALYLSDLGSRNFTYLNGRRLHSHEVRVVKDGDEITLGQLTARIHFHKSSKK